MSRVTVVPIAVGRLDDRAHQLAARCRGRRRAAPGRTPTASPTPRRAGPSPSGAQRRRAARGRRPGVRGGLGAVGDVLAEVVEGDLRGRRRVSARTAASASASVSPATKRSTTRRVAGLPVTTRRRPGRRDAASSAFCSARAPPGRGEQHLDARHADPPPDQGQMSRTRRALIHLYDTRHLWHTCGKRDGGARRPAGPGGRGVPAARPPRRRWRTPSSPCSPSAPTTSSRTGARWTPSAPARSSPAAPPRGHARLVRGVRHRRGRRRRCARPADPAAGILTRLVHPGAARRPHPRLPVAARRRPHRPGRRRRPGAAPRPSSSPPRPAGCSPSAPRPTRTSAARWPPRSPAAPPPAARGPALAAALGERTAPRCWWRCSRARPACRPAGGCPVRARSPTAARDGRRGRSPSSCRCSAPGDLRPAGALAAASLAAPAAGQRRRGLRGPPRLRRAARAVGARPAPPPGWPPPFPRFSPVAHWAELGAWRPITELRAARSRRRRRCSPTRCSPGRRRCSSTAPAARPAPRRRCRSTGRRCTTGSPGSRRSPAWTWPTARHRLLLHRARPP